MKKFLVIFGGLSLILMLVIGALLGYVAYRGNGTDASSKAYVKANLPPILSTWSRDELMKRASPQLVEIVKEQKEKGKDLDRLFKFLSRLGPLKSLGDIKGESKISLMLEDGVIITAHYIAKAKFQNGEGTVKVRLIQSPSTGQWQILYFSVYSPALLP